jgi:hypothetical protein
MHVRAFYLVKAAQFRLRAQTEQDMGVRWAMEALVRDYTRMADGLGNETALTVDFEKTTHSLGR